MFQFFKIKINSTRSYSHITGFKASYMITGFNTNYMIIGFNAKLPVQRNLRNKYTHFDVNMCNKKIKFGKNKLLSSVYNYILLITVKYWISLQQGFKTLSARDMISRLQSKFLMQEIVTVVSKHFNPSMIAICILGDLCAYWISVKENCVLYLWALKSMTLICKWQFCDKDKKWC